MYNRDSRGRKKERQKPFWKKILSFLPKDKKPTEKRETTGCVVNTARERESCSVERELEYRNKPNMKTAVKSEKFSRKSDFGLAG